MDGHRSNLGVLFGHQSISDFISETIGKPLSQTDFNVVSSCELKIRKQSDGLTIAQALRSNSTLTTLDLSGNKIEDTGATAIAEALKSNFTLTTLDLHGNEIEDKGAAAIAHALIYNSILTTLSLQYNDVSKPIELSIRKHMETNNHNKIMRTKTLQQLCCSAFSSADKNILKIDFPSFYILYFSLS